jgi:hypothetical protein
MIRIARMARVLALIIAPALLFAQQKPAFPHKDHQNLFPTCLGCHAGIPKGDAASLFPAPALCANCHDGKTMPPVEWKQPAPRGPGLLVLSHRSHLGKAEDVGCAACHATGRDTAWMHVVRAAPERCLSCHVHEASSHLADDNDCSTCHRKLTAATGLSDQRLAAFPQPASHAAPGFTSAHGKSALASGANCATCHARESCARCHVDAGRSKVIQALGKDSRVARLVANKAPSYPTPADHLAADFGPGHGAAARAGTARCATCHARSSCETCHTRDGALATISQLPGAREGGARGVQLRRVTAPAAPAAPASPAMQPAAGGAAFRVASSPRAQQPDTTTHKVLVHPPGFVRSHGALAASGGSQCASCHAQRFCTDCHIGGNAGRRYHAQNFVSVHPAKAYGRDTECSSCHNTATFCRSCHQQVGLAAKSGVRSTVYHNAQPFWLLEHGRAARQDLTNCTTCHQQTYCMQCHSDVGSRINPHGPDFNAAAMAKRNSLICLACHLKNPLGGK